MEAGIGQRGVQSSPPMKVYRSQLPPMPALGSFAFDSGRDALKKFFDALHVLNLSFHFIFAVVTERRFVRKKQIAREGDDEDDNRPVVAA